MTQPQNSRPRKICMIGASSVGKTSLVKRFVERTYDETEPYRTTIGVHLYEKSVTYDEKQVKLIIWDLEGKDDLGSEYPMRFLGGTEGYMLVADVTRPDTLDVVKNLLEAIKRHRQLESNNRFVLLINKQDVLHAPAMTNRAREIFGDGIRIFETSAKTGDRVEEAFEYLVMQMLEVGEKKSS